MTLTSAIARGHRGRVLLLCSALLAALPALRAVPVLKSATLRSASSPRLPASEWISLQYHLENPDPQAVTVRLSLRAAEHGRSVFEKQVYLGPRTQVRGREQLVADAASLYVLSVFLGGERLLREEIPVSSSDMPGQANLLILNDDPEFSGFGDLAKAALLRDTLGFTSATARTLPEQWVGYGHARTVVIAKPNYRDLSAAQFGALAAYVQRGGTALFADPEGTLAAAATPWAALLPVVPLRVRRTEALPELDAWGAELAESQSAEQRAARRPLADRDGFALLESAEQGEGLTVLRSGDTPVLRWRRYGLGRVGVVAVDPLHRRITESGVLVPLWTHILELSQPVFAVGNLENSRILPTVLSHLTGFSIPSAGAVGGLLLGYFTCLLGILIAGVVRRRQVLSWVVAAALGLVLTGAIFLWAFRQNATRAPATAAILDLRTSGGDRTAGNAVVSLFAKRDLRPAIRATDAASALRPLPSPARGKRREPLDAPLIVQREADVAGLSSITVQAFKPREFVAQYELPPLPVEPLTVLLGPTGPALRPGALPAVLGSRRARAFLLLAGGLVPLQRDGVRLLGLEQGGRLLDADPFLTDLARYLIEGAFPRPAVVVLQPWGEPGAAALPLDVPGFVREGCLVSFLPAAFECSGERLTLTPELLRIESLRLSQRLVMLQDEALQSLVLRSPRSVQVYDAVLPPVAADLRPAEVTVDLDVANAGGNLSFDVRLQRAPVVPDTPATEVSGMEAWDAALPATTKEPGRFRFSGPAAADLVQPASGRLRLLLELSQKQVITVGQDAERSNRWRVNRLLISVAGSVPKADQARRF